MAASNLLQEYKQSETKQIIVNKPIKVEQKYGKHLNSRNISNPNNPNHMVI